MALTKVSSQIDLVKLEEQTQQFWKDNKTFEKSISTRPEDNKYTFLDGPPFVTGNPHYGSLLPSIAKDVIPRYQTMLGKRVRRVWGWDCHGLPVEEKVNKLFGIKSSTQLEEKLGIEKYVQECRKYVQSASSDWRWYIEKIGRWVDMDNAYYTMSVDFMESTIWAFKQIYEKGYIYRGKRVSLFSTDTSTPVSQFEVAMDQDNYREVEDLSVFVKFETQKINDQPTFFVAWTTTPWTIPANFALAVNKDFDYSLVEYDGEQFIVATDRIGYTFNASKNEVGQKGDDEVKILKHFTGTELAGFSYKPVYDYFVKDASDNDFKVYLSDEVTTDEGTGVLHVAPAFGEVDFQLGQQNELSAKSDIDEEGNLTISPWKGTYLRDASQLITEDMQSNSVLLRSEVYTHRLPFYRGVNPLIYMAQDAYFINIQKIKERTLELNQTSNWIPNHIKNGRFAQTLETSPDWCISRNRYWATIMPIWKSSDGDEIIIGSLEELASLTDQLTKREIDGKFKYFFEDAPMDLHRDVCDKIILKKDGKTYHRIPEVLDCWMDSGSAGFAEFHYPFENKEEAEASQPADFVIEYVGQVRAWFNVLLRISTLLFDKEAFTNVICTGVLAGTDGRKMSKSFGNYPDPKMILEKYGGDALRLYFMSSPVMLGEDMNFSEEAVSDNYKFLLIYWNCYKFFVDYALTFDWSCEKPGGDGKNLNTLDKWILAQLTELVLSTRQSLDEYNIPTATKGLKDFLVNDFSTWYIRRSRDRVGSNDDESDRNTCLAVMYGVLVGFTKLMAPIAPFITESIYQNLTGDESVHLQNYPKGDKSMLDKELMANMVIVRQVVEAGHAKRKESEIKLRQPLAKLTYSLPTQLSSDLEQIMAEELNVKAIEYKKSDSGQLTVSLDLELTAELKAEGQARDLIRSIQQLRKEAGLTLSDQIKIQAPEWPETFEKEILKQTVATNIAKSSELKIDKI